MSQEVVVGTDDLRLGRGGRWWLRACGGGVDGWRGSRSGAEDSHASQRGEEREGEQCASAAAKQQGERASGLHRGGFCWQ